MTWVEQAGAARTLRWIAAVALLLLVLYAAGEVLLLVFAGILLAIPLRAVAEAIADRTSIAPGWALTAVLLCTAFLIGVGAWYLAPEIARQSQGLFDQVPRSWQGLQDRLGSIVGERLVDRVTAKIGFEDQGAVGNILARAFGVVSGLIGVIGSGVVILFVGLYVAAEPDPYRRGFIRLVPPCHRARAMNVLSKVQDTLLWWLIGKLASMSVVGLLTFLGLWFLDVPLALSLSLLACVLTFIPNFGPILSALPAILLTLGDGATQAGWAAGLYVAVQTVESYLITPLIQQRTVSLPPALTITAQLIAGSLAGIVGLALATPLTAAALVLVRELYVKELLESPRAASRHQRMSAE